MNNEKSLRAEYPADLIKSGERGKYANRYREGTNIVLYDGAFAIQFFRLGFVADYNISRKPPRLLSGNNQ